MDLSKKNAQILEMAIHFFSAKNQVRKCREEMFELLIEMSKLKGYHIEDRTFSYGLINEVSDVYIMINQMIMIIGEDRVRKQVNKKVCRLYHRIWDESQ